MSWKRCEYCHKVFDRTKQVCYKLTISTPNNDDLTFTTTSRWYCSRTCLIAVFRQQEQLQLEGAEK